MPWQCRMRAAEILGMARMSVMEVSILCGLSTTTSTDSYSCLVMAVSRFLTLDNIDTRWLSIDVMVRCSWIYRSLIIYPGMVFLHLPRQNS